MTHEAFLETLKDIPEINAISVDMTQANAPINVYEGVFILKDDKFEINIDGKIIFNWFPNSGVQFYGKTHSGSEFLEKVVNKVILFEIIINGLKFGNGFITNTNLDSLNNVCTIKGTMSGQAILGDKSIAVNLIKFSIANLREFEGTPVKSISDIGFSISNNRLLLEDDNYIISIDKYKDYTDRVNSLKENGGYNLLYTGQLISKKGALTCSESLDLFHCLNKFLSFLNGRRISALFIKGVHDDEDVWCDYTSYFTDPFKSVTSWPQQNSVCGLNEVWRNFNAIWQETDDKIFLNSAINWYVEANDNSRLLESSIILAQTALELIYNWWIIEKKGMILGKDSENITATNKIRLLLSQVNIDKNVPNGFHQLQDFLKSTDNIMDAPEAFVYIRNAIVHSQEDKRKKLSQIDARAKYEVLQLSIWYIEMSLLRILNFNEQYCNRCSNEVYAINAETNVPWKWK